METTKKARLEFNEKELEVIYAALNRLAVHYSEKSESLKKICGDVEKGITEWVEPDYYQQQWDFVGRIKQVVYKAEKRLSK